MIIGSEQNLEKRKHEGNIDLEKPISEDEEEEEEEKTEYIYETEEDELVDENDEAYLEAMA